MSDYYSILGLTKSATSAEIKAAYRKLVKIYHPDKNPNSYEAVDKFRQIQQAYETLIDPIARSKYDGKVSYNQYFSQQTTQAKPQQTRGKRYSFTEEDLKRRQYYKEHYKQQYEAGKKVNSQEEKKRYNETRYILIAIPMAIALLFFIINIYERKEKKQSNTKIEDTVVAKDTLINATIEGKEKISTSAEPYNYFFGSPKIDKNSNQVVAVNNYSGSDAIVCIVDAATDKVVRHYFIENSFNLYYEYLPEGKYYLRNYLGEKFELEKKIDSLEIIGAFNKVKQFQAFKKKTFDIKLQKSDTIIFDITYIDNLESKNIISQKEFFFR